MACAAADSLRLFAEVADAADRAEVLVADESRQIQPASNVIGHKKNETSENPLIQSMQFEVSRLAQELRDGLAVSGQHDASGTDSCTGTVHLSCRASSVKPSGSAATYTATLATPPLPLPAPAEPCAESPHDGIVSAPPDLHAVEEIEPVDLPREGVTCTGPAEVSTTSRTDPVPSDSPTTAQPYRLGVQRILGAARSFCRWIIRMRRVCTALVTTSSGLLQVGRPNSLPHAVLVLLRGAPVLLDSLLPALSWMNLIPCSQATGLCTSSAILCLVLYPTMSGAAGIAFVGRVAGLAAEASYSLLACWAKMSSSASQLVYNSRQSCQLTAAALGRSGSSAFDMLPAIDFGLTSAAFLHLVVSSSLRWRSGKSATVVQEMPVDLRELGFMAKIMYDPQLPPSVPHKGRTLHLVKQLSTSIMAVYATKDLLTGGDVTDVKGEVAVCHRGTWTARDLPDDLHVMCGTFRSSFRYRDAMARTTELIRMWPSAKFLHVGHSLGGTVALALLSRLPQRVNAEAHAFNPGVSFEGFFGPRSTVHLIEKDFIGYCTPAHPGCLTRVYPAHKGVKYLPWFGHPHSVDNFKSSPSW